MTCRRISSVLAVLLLAGCGGAEPGGPPPTRGSPPVAGGLVSGDGSDLCLQDADLPPGYLPLTGRDNTSNATREWSGEVAPNQAAAEALAASWSVHPERAPGPDDKPATCSIYIFDTAEIDDIYAWYTESYPARWAPSPVEVPVEVPVPQGGPGEDPHLFHWESNAGREGYIYVFRYGNAILDVGVDVGEGELMADEVIPLAQDVHDRVAAAAV